MSTVTQTIRDRLAEIDARIERLRAEVAKAEDDKRDLQTTVRVLEGIGVVDQVDAELVRVKPRRSRPASEKKKLMLDILGVGEAQGKAPATVHKALVASGIDDINIGTVRTTLWRTAQAGEIEGANGAYWKREAENPLFSESSAQSSSTGMTPGGTPHYDL